MPGMAATPPKAGVRLLEFDQFFVAAYDPLALAQAQDWRVLMANRLHRFLWRLWVVVSGLWVFLWILAGIHPEMRTDNGELFMFWPGYWIFVLGPPLVLMVLGALLTWVLDGLRD